MKTILYSLLGTTLDQGETTKRWNYWRPSVSICQQEDLLIDEYNLIYPRKFLKLATIVDKDINLVSPETNVIKHCLDFKDPWDFEEVYSGLHDFLKNLAFTPEDHQYLFHITTGTHVAQICIFLLTESHYFPGKLLQTGPSRDDPTGLYFIIDLDLSKYDKIASRFAEETKDDISFLKSGIETRNPAFNKLIERIELVALRSANPILLTGPTGSGKSRLARRIYELKKLRSQIKGKFVEVNCATLKGDTAMSTLFGHKKGSFTGAVNERDGLLKTADGGIVFLDEIGELGLDEQAMLLQSIEEKKFMSMGADHEIESDFQIICGTNHDLQQDIKTGLFRDDLLARINLWTFKLPGLRERSEDIEPNIKYELNSYAQQTGNYISFNKEAKTIFLQFAMSSSTKWYANFRDLNGAIVRMCTLALGGRINTQLVNEEIDRLKTLWQIQPDEIDPVDILETICKININQIDMFDKPQLSGVINICRSSKSLSEAGRKLFAFSRLSKNNPNDADRLRKYLSRFGLEWKDIEEIY